MSELAGKGEASGRQSVTALAGGDLALPAGIQFSDLEYISVRVLGIAVVITLIGIFALKRFAARSIGLMITIVVAATVITTLAGVGVIAYRMVGTAAERDDVLDLMAIAGLAGLRWRCSWAAGSPRPAGRCPPRCRASARTASTWLRS